MNYTNPYGNIYGAFNGFNNIPAYGYGTQPQMPNYGMPTQGPDQPVQQDDGLQKVSGKDGALALGYKLGKNCATIAIDQTEEDIEWLIVTDATGIPTLRRLRFTDAEEVEEKKDATTEQNPSYVTFKEFDDLRKQVASLINDLGGEKNE